MGGADLRAVIRRLSGAAANRRGGGLDDGELLRRFVASRDEAAFEALVWRHAGLVYGMCRRVLRNAQDAEDAFQATFLVLARKAETIRKGTSVGGWLYQVACRTALRARARQARRACVEPLVEEPPAPPADDAAWRDLRPVLDEEISRLPEKYRAPFVLCYLQGLTCGEAGRELGCPAGTVMTRLARARERLRAGLTRRGISLPAGMIAAGVLPGLAAAAPPAGLAASAAEAGLALLAGKDSCAAAQALLLSEEVMRAMFTNTFRIAVVSVAGVLVFGAAVTIYSLASAVADPPVPPDRPKVAVAETPKRGLMPRGEGDRPAGASGRLGSLRFRSAGGMPAAFAPDGKTVAFGGALWDVKSGERIAEVRVRPGDAVVRPRFSPDGKFLLAAGPERPSPVGLVYVWDAATGRELHRLTPPPTDPRAGRIHDAVFSADGKTVIALANTFVHFKRPPDENRTPGWENEPGFVLLTWEATSGKVLKASRVLPGIHVPAGGGPPMACGLSPGGRVAGAWVGESLRLWDVGAGRELPAIPAEYQGGTIAFSPDSQFVYLGGRGVSRREVKSGKVAYDLGAEDGHTPFSLSQDGKLLTTLGRERVASVRDAGTGKVVRQLPVQKQGDGGLYRPEPVLSPDGAVLATESAGALALWDAATGKELFPADGHYGPVSAVAFSPDGRRIASAGQDGMICLWDRAGSRPPTRLTRLPSAALALAFSPRGETLRVVTSDKERPWTSVRLIDAGTGKELRKFALEGGFDTGANAPAGFSPDGKLLAGRGHVTGSPHGLTVWSTESGIRVAAWRPERPGADRVDALSDWLLAVAFAPDGVLASATNEAIVVWDAAERRVLRTIPLPGNRARGAVPFWPSALAFSADGRLVIATDASRRTMRAWELVSGRELSDFVGVLPSGALSVAAAPDGVSFVTGHWDTTLLLWDIPALLRGPGARATPRPPSKERLRVLWQALADSDDAGRALRAVGELAAAPAQAVPFLAGEVEEPTPPPDRLARLIADLEAKSFATREKATRELAEIGGPAEPALREAIRKGASAEAGRRIEGLLAAVRSQNSPASRRWSRAVQALEYAGTPEARRLLERIGRGPLGGRSAEQARGALDRLARRPAAAGRKGP